MSDQKDKISRREALKGMTAGAGVIASLPVLGAGAAAQDHAHHMSQARPAVGEKKPEPLKFFNAEENRTVIEMTERIIPADDSSPGAKAVGVSQYIDLVVSLSPDLTKQTWRDGLAAVNKMSAGKFGKGFADATEAQQVELLTEISKNERDPKTVEEKFFRTVKNATVDGYYTSEVGIKTELKYKGNSFLKEFTGCTHPEHQG